MDRKKKEAIKAEEWKKQAQWTATDEWTASQQPGREIKTLSNSTHTTIIHEAGPASHPQHRAPAHLTLTLT